jgi:hypothetical protein
MRDRLFSLTKLPRTLRETGKVTEAQLDEVAEKALNDGSIIYNPKKQFKRSTCNFAKSLVIHLDNKQIKALIYKLSGLLIYEFLFIFFSNWQKNC